MPRLRTAWVPAHRRSGVELGRPRHPLLVPERPAGTVPAMPRPARPRQRKPGAFTLLELVVVIVILAILALLAVPSFSSVISKSHYSGLEESGRALDHDAVAVAAFTGSSAAADTAAQAKAIAELPSSVTAGTPTGGQVTLSDAAGYSVCVTFGATLNAYGTVTDGACSATATTVAAPVSPTGLVATPGNAQVALAWAPTAGATSYQVYRDGTPLAAEATNSFTDTTAANGTPHTYTVAAIGPGGTSPQNYGVSVTPSVYAATVVGDGPAIYWQMSETSAAAFINDSSGHTNTGGYGGSPTVAQPPVNSHIGGYSVYLPTTNWSQITPSGGSAPVTLPAMFSMETWFKTTNVGGGYLMGWMNTLQSSPAPTAWDPVVYMTGNNVSGVNPGEICFETYNSGQKYFCTTGSYNDGNWHDVMAVAGPTGMVLYVDGVQVGSNSVVNAESYGGYFHVGGGYLQSIPNADYWNLVGSLTNASMYPSALSASQASNHFAAASK